jgi:hypothetical protein
MVIRNLSYDILNGTTQGWVCPFGQFLLTKIEINDFNWPNQVIAEH